MLFKCRKIKLKKKHSVYTQLKYVLTPNENNGDVDVKSRCHLYYVREYFFFYRPTNGVVNTMMIYDL